MVMPSRAIDQVYYPDSDGRPMADNDLHALSINYLYDAVRAALGRRSDLFVANNMLWYYEQGNPKARINPDVFVAFGASPAPRGSYKQWVDGPAPQVVFEVISPVDDQQPPFEEMSSKYSRYLALGVKEYVVYRPPYGRFPYWERLAADPDLHGFIRRDDDDDTVIPYVNLIGTRSPRLGVIYAWGHDPQLPLVLLDGDDRPLLEHLDVIDELEAQRHRADAESERADAERQRADAERQRADRLAERLRAAGLDANGLHPPDRGP